MRNIFPYVAGNTLGAHETFLNKLRQGGANVVDSPGSSDVAIIFCPIISRFGTDVTEALSGAAEKGCEGDVIVVAMHHTFDKNYPLASRRQPFSDSVVLLVDCLFYDQQGLLKCRCNDEAVERVFQKLGLNERFYDCECCISRECWSWLYGCCSWC